MSAPENLHLEVATIADLEELLTLERAIFGTDAWSSESMASELTSEWTDYAKLVGTNPQRVLGYVGLAWTVDGPADLNTIALHPEVRGSGWGQRLLDYALDRARTHGAAECLLEVRGDNPVAQSLYLKNGFEQIAIRPNYYQPDGVDAIIMRRPLTREAASD